MEMMDMGNMCYGFHADSICSLSGSCDRLRSGGYTTFHPNLAAKHSLIYGLNTSTNTNQSNHANRSL